MRAENNMREGHAFGRAPRLRLQADQLRPGKVTVFQRAVQLAVVLGDVRWQDHVQTAGSGRGVQNRHHRVDQLPAELVGSAYQEQPVPGDVQAGAEPGQTRSGRDLRADDRVAGQLLRDAHAGPGPDVADHYVLHQAVLVHRQLQPRSKGVQPVTDAYHDYVHAARGVFVVHDRLADGRHQNHAVEVLRPVQGAAVRVESTCRYRTHCFRAPVGGYRLPGADQRKLRVAVVVRSAVRRVLLPRGDGIQQEDDNGAAQTAGA